MADETPRAPPPDGPDWFLHAEPEQIRARLCSMLVAGYVEARKQGNVSAAISATTKLADLLADRLSPKKTGASPADVRAYLTAKRQDDAA
ncbi:hypothetical protein ACFQU1_04905 [Chelatococcus sp. GCM10030263]|uniref:hypothetical protein n=1 Tax=Chelatococcus sp. GCM10030263 TaxID=3273387 RepID=UPI00360FD135